VAFREDDRQSQIKRGARDAKSQARNVANQGKQQLQRGKNNLNKREWGMKCSISSRFIHCCISFISICLATQASDLVNVGLISNVNAAARQEHMYLLTYLSCSAASKTATGASGAAADDNGFQCITIVDAACVL
jgi:hypothetical protein